MSSEPQVLQHVLDEALSSAQRDKRNAFGLIYVAHTYLQAGRADEAASIARRAAELDADNADVLRGASGIFHVIGDYRSCLPYCRRGVALSPDDPELRQHYAIVLLSLHEYRAAAAQFEAQLALDPTSALAWRNLAGAFQSLGELDQALEASARAIDLDPGNSEFGIHRAGMHAQLGQAREALAELKRIEHQSGQNATVAWLYAAVFDSIGDLDAAARYAERAHRLAPDNDSFAQYSRSLEERRASTQLTEPPAPGAAGPPDPAARSQWTGHANTAIARGRRRQEYENPIVKGVRIQSRIILALLLRETRTRFGNMKIGYIWALIEPISHLALIATVFYTTTHGVSPIGQSILVYYFTGVVPYLTFSNTVMGVAHSLEANRYLMQIPIVHQTDILVARAILELLTQLTVGAIVLTAFIVIGLPAIPNDPLEVLTGLLFVWSIGFGVGMINSVMMHFIKSWSHIFNNVVRALYFTSGVFLSPLQMPDWIRDILAWNPILQSIDWIRHGFFADYDPAWLDREYVVIWAALSVTIGFAMERVFRRRLTSE